MKTMILCAIVGTGLWGLEGGMAAGALGAWLAMIAGDEECAARVDGSLQPEAVGTYRAGVPIIALFIVVTAFALALAAPH